MAYPVDLKLKGTALLLGLVNYDNNLTLQESDVVMVRPPVAQPEGSLRNTQTTIVTTDPDYIEGVDAADVQVMYNRIDVGILFSVVECMVRENNIDMVDGVPTINGKIFDEINRRYGLNASNEDFTLSLDAEQRLFITAKEVSLAYIGTREVRIISALASRIAMPVLDGFHVQEIDNTHVLVPNEAYPVNSTYTTTDQNALPETLFGGTWTRQPSIVLTVDELPYYNLGVGHVVELIGEEVPKSAHYDFIVLGNDTAYNEGKAETVTLSNGKQGVKVTLATSPLHNREFEAVPSIQGSKAYMLIKRAEGNVSSTAAPEYVWKRTA